MAFVENSLHLSVDNIPPCLDLLRNFEKNAPALSNIEDGLCCPDDQILFLTASMSFLQTRLMKKLNDEAVDKNVRQKTYSNLLILENNPKSKQTKYYLKLKNIDRYDKVLEKEASMPSSTLSLNQILPRPKKSKTIFKLVQKMQINNENKSESTYNLFKNHGDETKCKSTICLLNDSIQTIWSSRISQLQHSQNVLRDNPSTSSTNNFELGVAANRIAVAKNFKKPSVIEKASCKQTLQKNYDCSLHDVENKLLLNNRIIKDCNFDNYAFEQTNKNTNQK